MPEEKPTAMELILFRLVQDCRRDVINAEDSDLAANIGQRYMKSYLWKRYNSLFTIEFRDGDYYNSKGTNISDHVNWAIRESKVLLKPTDAEGALFPEQLQEDAQKKFTKTYEVYLHPGHTAQRFLV